MLKPNAGAKRVEEIQDIENRIRKLAEEYKNDFTELYALDHVIDKDLQAAMNSLELLKGLYTSAQATGPGLHGSNR